MGDISEYAYLFIWVDFVVSFLDDKVRRLGVLGPLLDRALHGGIDPADLHAGRHHGLPVLHAVLEHEHAGEVVPAHPELAERHDVGVREGLGALGHVGRHDHGEELPDAVDGEDLLREVDAVAGDDGHLDAGAAEGLEEVAGACDQGDLVGVDVALLADPDPLLADGLRRVLGRLEPQGVHDDLRAVEEAHGLAPPVLDELLRGHGGEPVPLDPDLPDHVPDVIRADERLVKVEERDVKVTEIDLC